MVERKLECRSRVAPAKPGAEVARSADLYAWVRASSTIRRRAAAVIRARSNFRSTI